MGNTHLKRELEVLQTTERESAERDEKLKELMRLLTKLDTEVSGSQAHERPTLSGILGRFREYIDENADLRAQLRSTINRTTKLFQSQVEDAFSIEEVLQHYDLVVLMETLERGDQGWPVRCYNPNLYEVLPTTSDQISPSSRIQIAPLAKTPVTVCVVGWFASGKTHVLSMLARIKLPEGAAITTRGLAMKMVVVKGVTLELVDAAGFQVPTGNDPYEAESEGEESESIPTIRSEQTQTIQPESVPNRNQQKNRIRKRTEMLMSRVRDEHFIYNAALRVSNGFMVVVDKMTLQQQVLIEQVKDQLRTGRIGGHKGGFLPSGQRDQFDSSQAQLYVVHNSYAVMRRELLDRVIKEQIEGPFEVAERQIEVVYQVTEDGEKVNTLGTVTYWMEIGEVPAIHVVLVNDYSPFGEKFNPPVYEFLRTSLAYLKVRADQRGFLERLQKDSLDQVLPKFVSLSQDTPTKVEFEASVTPNGTIARIFPNIESRGRMQFRYHVPLNEGSGLLLQDLRIPLEVAVDLLDKRGTQMKKTEFVVVAETPGLTEETLQRTTKAGLDGSWPVTFEPEVMYGRYLLSGDHGAIILHLRKRKTDRVDTFKLISEEDRSEGRFQQRIDIPRYFNIRGIMTEVKNGILRMRFPRFPSGWGDEDEDWLYRVPAQSRSPEIDED